MESFWGYKFKETKSDRFGKRPAATEADDLNHRSTIDRRRRTWTPSAGRSSCFFFLFLRSSNNFRSAFLASKVASQSFTWKISICSAKKNHVLRCSFSRELATWRARLGTTGPGAASQLQLTTERAAWCPGWVSPEKILAKVRLGQQSYSICLERLKSELIFSLAHFLSIAFSPFVSEV